MQNLAEALQKEITRVRDTILPLYLEIGPAGVFGAAFIKKDLDEAVAALSEGDALRCIESYKTLKEIEG